MNTPQAYDELYGALDTTRQDFEFGMKVMQDESQDLGSSIANVYTKVFSNPLMEQGEYITYRDGPKSTPATGDIIIVVADNPLTSYKVIFLPGFWVAPAGIFPFGGDRAMQLTEDISLINIQAGGCRATYAEGTTEYIHSVYAVSKTILQED